MTPQQRKLLTFIEENTVDDVSPSYEEMRKGMGLKSKSGINRLIKGLERRGYITRMPNMARSITVVSKPAKGEILLMVTKHTKLDNPYFQAKDFTSWAYMSDLKDGDEIAITIKNIELRKEKIYEQRSNT